MRGAAACLIALFAISQAGTGEAPDQQRGAAAHALPSVGYRNEPARGRPHVLTPVITSITPDHGDEYDTIVVKGANFPAAVNEIGAEPDPLDVGFIYVRFGNRKAGFVPVTHTLMYVTVPHMPVGDVMVTIQNEYGVSNPVHFKVEPAWWNFWSNYEQ